MSGYNCLNTMKDGGDTWEIAGDLNVKSGGAMAVESGGSLDIESGGALKLAGTTVTATAAEINSALDTNTATAAELSTLHGALAGATITPGTADSGAVEIQLEDAAGEDFGESGMVLAWVSDDAAGDVLAVTAPDGGVAIGTDGTLFDVIANKMFWLKSEADGHIDLVITESGTDTF